MDNVPKMISAKDLDFIKDMLQWNLIACKKASHYEEEIQDEEIKEMINSTSNMHVDHYKYILDFLK